MYCHIYIAIDIYKIYPDVYFCKHWSLTKRKKIEKREARHGKRKHTVWSYKANDREQFDASLLHESGTSDGQPVVHGGLWRYNTTTQTSSNAFDIGNKN